MKQQHFKAAARGREDQEQQFQFVQFPQNNDRNAGPPRDHRSKKTQGFARWSDYITYDSDDLEVPVSDEGSISISNDHAENSSLTQMSISKEPISAPPATVTKQLGKAEINPPINQADEQHKGNEQNMYKENNSLPVSLNKNQKNAPSLSPFSLPSNISEVKPKDVTHFNGRNSQQFLLDLLNHECQNFEEKQQFVKQNGAKPIEKAAKRQQPIQKLQKNERRQSRKSQKEVQRHEPKQPLKKQRQNIVIKRQRQIIAPISKQPLKQAQNNTKSRRVTINDRGKIKFPNDSISCQFQYILPVEFRESESQSSRKRKFVIQQEQDDEDKVIPKKEEPMDIVNPRQQAEKIAKQKQRDVIKKAEEKLKALAKNAPKLQVPKQKKPKATRLCDKKQEKQGEDQSSKRSISTNRYLVTKNDSIANKKTLEEKDIKPSTVKSQVVKAQRKIRKFKKQDQSQVEVVSQRESPPKVNQRPKRNRTGKCQYWRNQKPFYNKKNQNLGKTNVTNQELLKMIGVHQYDKLNLSTVTFSGVGMKMAIHLRPKQKFYSSGINLSIMEQFKFQQKHFNQVSLLLNEKDIKKAEDIKGVIDDVEEVKMKNGMYVSIGQTFSMENLTTNKTFIICVSFHNGEQDEDEDESQDGDSE